MNWLIKNFLRGLVIVVPTALTIWLLYVSFTSLDRLLKLDVPGLGLLIILGGTIVLGAIAGNFVGRRLLRLVEMIFTKAPIVRIVYAAIKDRLVAFVGNRRRFDKPVVVTLSDGVKVFGFVTRPDLETLTLPGDVGVYVPFSYTWDGCLLVVEKARVRALEADSASIMALVVSGGVSRAGSE
jgi:uncharacterized membrane protein